MNNAGITDAKSVVLTVLQPAKPVEPYAEYAVGSLASDDFSSFTLTFTVQDLASVPVRVTWKDTDGNSFSTVKNLDLRSSSGLSSSSARTGSSGSGTTIGGTTGNTATRGSGGGPQGGGGIFGFGGNRSGGLSAFYPVIGLGIVVVVGIVLWVKRKWITSKLKKK